VGLRRDSPDRLDRSGAGRAAADLAALALADAGFAATGAELAAELAAEAVAGGTVSALRRSRAASRLVVLAMSARKIKGSNKILKQPA